MLVLPSPVLLQSQTVAGVGDTRCYMGLCRICSPYERRPSPSSHMCVGCVVSNIDDARALCKAPDVLKKESMHRCGDWHAPIPHLIRNADVLTISGYPVFDRDPLAAQDLRTGGGSTNEHSCVTLIGDAVWYYH